MLIKSYAKINLSLEVISKRDDGYHEIDTLMNRISLFDEISFELTNENRLILSSNKKNFPTDERNLIYRAWEILKKYRKDDCGVKIHVNKNIPIAAGLAGGTANGIDTIKALNQLWKLNFSKEELLELAKPLGADSSFFFYDGLVRARGIGEKIVEIKKLDKLPLLLINNGQEVSSKDIYTRLKNYSMGKIESIVNNIENFTYLKNNLFNSMEQVTCKLHPEIIDIKNTLLNLDASCSLMSGSGPSVFGIFDSEEKRDKAYLNLKDEYKYVIKTHII